MPSLYEVTQAFVDDGPPQGTRNGSLTYEKYSDGTRRLWSYSTCLAEYKDGKFYVNITKYSRTTTRHQFNVLGHLDRKAIKYYEIANVMQGTPRLAILFDGRQDYVGSGL